MSSIGASINTRSKDKLYRVTCMLGKGPVGVEIVDEKRLLKANQEIFDVYDISIRGFSQFNTLNHLELVYKKSLGRKPLDFEFFRGFWLLSEAAKNVFEQVSAKSIEFIEVILKFEDGSNPINIWICDVTLVLDALEEHLSDIRILSYGSKIYNLSGAQNFVFDRKRIGDQHIFRMKYAETAVICDSHVRDRCKLAKIRGVKFIEVG